MKKTTAAQPRKAAAPKPAVANEAATAPDAAAATDANEQVAPSEPAEPAAPAADPEPAPVAEGAEPAASAPAPESAPTVEAAAPVEPASQDGSDAAISPAGALGVPFDEEEVLARLRALTPEERATFGSIMLKLGAPPHELALLGLGVEAGAAEEATDLPEVADLDLDGRVLLVRSVRKEGRRRSGINFTPEAIEVYPDQLTADEIGALLADPQLLVELD